MKKFELEKRFAKKWLSALRSGEYNQTKGHLKDDKGYCCLGVACRLNGISDDKIYGKSFPNKTWTPEILNVPDVNEREFFLLVSNKNDEGETFTEIADWIESNVEFI